MKKEFMVFVGNDPTLLVTEDICAETVGAFALAYPTDIVSTEPRETTGQAMDFVPYFARKMVEGMRTNRRARRHRRVA